MKNLLLFLSSMALLGGCTDNYEEGIKKYNEKKYNDALISLSKIKESDSNYNEAQSKITEIRAIVAEIKEEDFKRNQALIIEKAIKDSVLMVEKIKQELEDFKFNLEREIISVKLNSERSSMYSDVREMQLEIARFTAWAIAAEDAKKHDNKDVNRLGNTLAAKVTTLQKSRFPKMRSRYGEILKDKLWAENIKVKTKDAGSKTLEFEGGIFANNKNKQDAQDALREMFDLLRFKRIYYKWYEYDDESTYYKLETKEDGEL